MYQWLGIAIIIIGLVGLLIAFATKETSQCRDPNIDDLIDVSKRLSREQLKSVIEKAESYVD